MQIKILFDSESINFDFQSGLGFSCLLREDVLFDAGADEASLRKNIEILDVDISLIKHIIISHDHWDHVGGLWWILENTMDVTVYICPGFSKEFIEKLLSTNANVVQCVAPQPIAKDIWTTGQIEGRYKDNPIFEQVVILKGNQGIRIVTGCAHPGIIEILKRVKTSFPNDSIDLVLGGFHLLNEDKETIGRIIEKFKSFKVKKVAPVHCSGKLTQDIFKKEYKENYIVGKSGKIIR